MLKAQQFEVHVEQQVTEREANAEQARVEFESKLDELKERVVGGCEWHEQSCKFQLVADDSLLAALDDQRKLATENTAELNKRYQQLWAPFDSVKQLVQKEKRRLEVVRGKLVAIQSAMEEARL